MGNDSIERLRKRLKDNFDAYTQPLLAKSPPELIGLASEIAERKRILDHLPRHCSADDAERLLRFTNPLEVARGIWEGDGNYEYDDEFDHLLWELQDKEGDYHDLYDPSETSSALIAQKERFEGFFHQIVPEADRQATEDWWSYALDMETDGSTGFIEELQSAFDFIARNFRSETVREVYEIIEYGSALPSELMAAAVYLEYGDTPERMAELADTGALMCFLPPKTAGEASPLSLISVIEDGKTETFYTLSYGSFQPEDVLRCAKEFAAEYQCSVAEVIRDGFQTSLLRKKYDLCRNLYTGNEPGMTKAMLAIFKTCPAIAAHTTINADTGEITTDRNPLWRKAVKDQKQSKSHRKKISKKQER